ncbi:enoyl-CoA hydratase/isomerase family protein [Dictyobacter aurantiacus]|uniref:Enoyl-CoA hydratase n=1 Tax=Dictyobacter aurantiacus TaxID=1936993 RepID=A0A401ZC03_9CHLR|nr:enoyl-CoA hydratase/isomerase family protein [Dictyobacter aurantiacus]GCE04372.1 hypothetical protein KDAU_17010 [Dictyobacter aurantiacus]
MSDIHVRQRNGILWLILDRHPRNMLTAAMLEQLSAALFKARNKPPRLIVLTGMGEEAFCAGLDLPDDAIAHNQALADTAHAIELALEALQAQGIPTVALIKGATWGAGCELAILCGTIFARDDTTLCLPVPGHSLFPRALTTALPALVGETETQHLLERSEPLNAADAMSLGLVHQILSPRRFLQDAEELLTMLISVA